MRRFMTDSIQASNRSRDRISFPLVSKSLDLAAVDYTVSLGFGYEVGFLEVFYETSIDAIDIASLTNPRNMPTITEIEMATAMRMSVIGIRDVGCSGVFRRLG